MPNFGATLGTPQSNVTGDGTIATLICNTLASGAGYNVSNGIFTAPMAGYYIFPLLIDLLSLTSSHTIGIGTLIATSGSYIFRQLNVGAALNSNNAHMMQSIVPVKMSLGDTAYVTLQVSNGAKSVTIGTLSTFSGSRLY